MQKAYRIKEKWEHAAQLKGLGLLGLIKANLFRFGSRKAFSSSRLAADGILMKVNRYMVDITNIERHKQQLAKK